MEGVDRPAPGGSPGLPSRGVLERPLGEAPLTTATAWFLGLLLGMRHALEPDHLAALSTLVTEENDPRSGLWLGAFWGVGHTLALLGVGLVLALLRTTMSDDLIVAFELVVSGMLLFLGLRALLRARTEMAKGPPRRHEHGGPLHVHAGPGAHVHLGRRAYAVRPLVVGLIHGLAGSGALTALVLAGFDTNLDRLGYTLVFGVGSILGMGLLTGIAGWPLARLVATPRARGWTSVAAGTLSVAMGLLWGWPLLPKLLG
jgi:ABC-type nickel/cobalt efflux system permease component RcnA